MSTPRHRFAQLCLLEDDAIDVLRGALLIAAEEDPSADVEATAAEIEAIGARVADHLAGAEDFFHAVWAINRILFEEMGIRGDTEAYDDPDNSLMHRVLERRRGIPITLCILYREVARRAGFAVEGVGLPGHFVVQIEDDWGRTYVDPFHGGEVVSRKDLEALLHQRFGPRARLLDEHLEPVGARQILARILVNLKRIHVRREDYARALKASERILLLQPGAHGERRDRGLLYRRTGQHDAAITDLRVYLLDRPDATDAPRIRRLLQGMLQKRRGEA